MFKFVSTMTYFFSTRTQKTWVKKEHPKYLKKKKKKNAIQKSWIDSLQTHCMVSGRSSMSGHLTKMTVSASSFARWQLAIAEVQGVELF